MEKDLFLPVKEYFEALGYAGDGEVAGIDLYMEKGEESLAVELKQTLDFKALQQAALRQKIADTVYIGIFQPANERSRSFQERVYLLKRLGIGLIAVSKRTGAVRVLSEPVVSELSAFQKRNQKKKKNLSRELGKRKTRSNTGGVHRTKLVTSYRESALLVLDAMMELGGEGSTRQIRKLSGEPKSTQILYNNHYGWFENTAKGQYRVTEKGENALEEFEDIIRMLKQ